ncbi:hypothetical protein DV736_g307, partial [Chaetothyriales sp. CBS 134916]
MSEYWKSTPKYWCKHCSSYVRDTAFERRQHESTAKHQNSLKRFLRDIQNNHEREEREKERARAEVERLNKISGSGVVPLSTPAKVPGPAPIFAKEKGGQRTVDDQKRQWQQLADMGIKVPDHVSTEMAMASDWKAVPQHSLDGPLEDGLSVGVRKRKAADEDDELAESLQWSAKRNVWGKSIKKLPASEEDDVDALLATTTRIPLKKEKQHDVSQKEEQESGDGSEHARSTDRSEDASDGRSYSASARKPVEARRSDNSGAEGPGRTEPKLEQSDIIATTSLGLSTIPEATTAPFFKKRKPKGKC